jgi:1-acyl-sn-glycerol-3-phosphate acyltransferase
MMLALKKMYKDKGALGVLEWIYDKKRFTFVKLFLKTVFIIFPYDSILKITAKYNHNIQKIGLSQSSRQYIQDLSINISKTNMPVIKGGCLIFGNHPTGLDPYILSSIIERDDVYIVADIYQQRKGNNIGKHIVPIVYARTQKNLDNREFLNKIGFYIMRQFTGYVDKNLVKIQNEQTVKTAGKLIQEGHVVIIFPDGGSNNPEFWYNGIGEVIKTASVKGNPVQLLAANISGISSFKLWRHFLFNRKTYLQKYPINVKLSQNLSLEDLQIKQTSQSREITERLRTEFKNQQLWVPNYAYNK